MVYVCRLWILFTCFKYSALFYGVVITTISMPDVSSSFLSSHSLLNSMKHAKYVFLGDYCHLSVCLSVCLPSCLLACLYVCLSAMTYIFLMCGLALVCLSTLIYCLSSFHFLIFGPFGGLCNTCMAFFLAHSEDFMAVSVISWLIDWVNSLKSLCLLSGPVYLTHNFTPSSSPWTHG